LNDTPHTPPEAQAAPAQEKGPDQKKPLSRWLLPGILLGVYILLRLHGWSVAVKVQALGKELENLRPTLSTKVLQQQIQDAYAACLGASEQVRQEDLQGGRLLTFLSQELPVSVAIERLEVKLKRRMTIEGNCWTGIRTPEAALLPWAERLRRFGPIVRIHRIIPDQEIPGLWHFEIQVRQG